MSTPHPVATPKTRPTATGTLRQAVALGRQTRIALTSLVRFGGQPRTLTQVGATREGDHTSTTTHLISRCRLCGSSQSPPDTHLCPRLYGR
jgi:hypothetical protein